MSDSDADAFCYCADSSAVDADEDEEYPVEGVTYTMSEAEFFTFLREYILGDSPITPRDTPRAETND